jgi:adenylate cyclase
MAEFCQIAAKRCKLRRMPTRLTFGPFVLDPGSGTLCRQGVPVPLSYRGFLLLSAFLDRPGEVVTKSDLIDVAWQGAAVEETNLSVQIASLRKHLGLSPEGADWIVTVPRVGYRFVGGVECQTDPARRLQTDEPEGRPSIAVLPFVNLTGDREQEYFADGVVEDLVTGLARIRWLSVIARSSTLAYKGAAVDVRQVGRELGVRYVLEGGVRRAGVRVRINAQLVDAATGGQIWAERFDGALEDVFDLQDQITEKVVAIVEPNVQRSEIERSRRKRPENLDAYDLYLRAVPYTASQMPGDARIAMPYLERALVLDPGYAAANALMAWCHEWCFARSGFDELDRRAALKHARLVTAGATDDATALAIAGFVITMLEKDHATGLSTTERALVLNPSCATAMYLGALTNAFSGRPTVAIALAERALRLSPFDVLAYQAHFALGAAAMEEARYADAAAHLREALKVNASLSSLYFVGAAAHALAGEANAAESLAERGLALEPGFRLRLFAELMAPAVALPFTEGCRLLGLPD